MPFSELPLQVEMNGTRGPACVQVLADTLTSYL